MIRINREQRRALDLLWLLTKKEVTLKYKRTNLGILWSLLNPMLLALVLVVAFKIFMRFRIENYTFFLLSALFPWNWFVTCVMLSTATLMGNVSLIKRVRFPRQFLVLAAVLSQLTNFLFSLPIIICLAYFYGNGPGISWFLGVPILLAIQFVVITGISMAISMVNAYFRDMEYIIGILVNMLFWLTPILYPLDMVPDAYRIYLTLNPLTSLITAWRQLFMDNIIAWDQIGASCVSAVAFLFIGVLVFQKLGRKLDEVI